MANFEYKPSQVVLDRVLPELLALRKSVDESLRLNWEAQRNVCGFHGGISDEQEDERQRQELWRQEAVLTGKRDLIDTLLRPFQREADELYEQHKKAECDRIMAL